MINKAFCILVLFIFSYAHSQIYPVTATWQIDPSSISGFANLAGYANYQYPLELELILNDLSISERRVVLKVSMQRSGLDLLNRNEAGSAEVVLESGVPKWISGEVLSHFFQPHQISAAYDATFTAPFPEGHYTICVEVIDKLSGKTLSNRSCVSFYASRQEPPVLLIPEKNSKLMVSTPQGILFQWMPRHAVNPNLRYRFRLTEIWDHTQDPQAAFLSTRPIFETVTPHNSFLYDFNAVPLLENKRYAWQVTVVSGQEELPVTNFSNRGESEIWWFEHVAPCRGVTDVAHLVKGRHQVNISWTDTGSDWATYMVRYRKKGSNHEWFHASTSFSAITLWGLEGETAYEYQVFKQCELSTSEYSSLKEFVTGQVNTEEDLYDCGIAPALNVKAEVPLQRLQPNETFTAGTFSVTVLEVQGGEGRFSGRGVVTIPYLANLRVAVTFTNIYINHDRQLAAGVVQTIYDKGMTNILDVDEVIDVGEDLVDEITGHDHHMIGPLATDINDEDIRVEDGKIIIVTADGSEVVFDHDEGDVTLVTDASGDQWEVNGNGEITRVGMGASGGPVTAVNTEGVVYDEEGRPKITAVQPAMGAMKFFEGEESRFALDQADNEWKKARYPKLKAPNQNDHYPIHKAVVAGKEEVFYAATTPAFDENIENLLIKTMEGRAIPLEVVNDTLFKITLSGLQGYLEEQALICVKEPEADKYRVLSTFYIHHLKDQGTIPLTLVEGRPGAITSDFPEVLEEVFGKVGAEFSINYSGVFLPEASLWDIENENGLLDYHGSGLLADYPKEFQAFHRQFIRSSFFSEPDDYHLFFLNGALNNTGGVAGFMPPGRQWGYVFSDGSPQEKQSAAAIAVHEIGHGVFGLEHPEEADRSGLLMSQATGIDLSYLDWQRMNENRPVTAWFDPDEEKEIGGKIWFTPDWTPFRVPETRVISSTPMAEVQEGTIPGFRVNDIYYHARMGEAGFSGYSDDHGNIYEITPVKNLAPEDTVYLFQYKGGCGHNRYYKAAYGSVQQDLPAPDLSDQTRYSYVATIPCETSSTGKDLFSEMICEAADEVAVDADLVTSLARDLETAHQNRESLGSASMSAKGTFYHLLNFDQEHSTVDQQILEDQLFLLKARTGINFYIYRYDTTGQGHLAFPGAVAQELLEAIPSLKQGSSILILAGTNTLTASDGMRECIRVGLGASDDSLLPASLQLFSAGRDLKTLVSAIFTSLKKPYKIHRYYLKASGEVMHTVQASGEGQEVSGLPFINAVNFYTSPFLDEIEKQQWVIGEAEAREKELEGTPENLERFRALRTEWTDDLNRLQLRAMEEDERALISDGSDYWVAHHSSLGVLRQGLLDNDTLVNAYYASSRGVEARLARWKMLFGTATLEPDQFYDYDPAAIVDDAVYTTLDLMSVIPHPYAEVGAELTGLIYAGMRGDLTSAVMYSTSLLVPYSGVVKTALSSGESGVKGYAVFARMEGEEIVFQTKGVQEALENEVQVTSILTGHREVAEKIEKNGFEELADISGIRKLLEGLDAVVSARNLKDIEWTLMPDCFQCKRSPLEFWDDTSVNRVHYLQDKYYIKHDLSTGELLVADMDSREVIAFYEGLENNAVVANASYAEVIRVSKRYMGRGELPVNITINTSNKAEIVSTPGRCTTIIGNYAVYPHGAGDMKGLSAELLLKLTHLMFDGPCNNGFNILNVARAVFEGAADFWEEFNKPWLLKAIERGDVIYAATDPMDLGKVVKIEPQYEIESIQDLKKYLINLDDFLVPNNLTGFGKELKLLFEKGYIFDVETKTFLK
ncbi:fibronectin type III domain-containing protein [Robertkochia marina]|uniref:Fibronectin type III domain-containing protein n=1 Tax=Robertkochia marina TaxID=1227945 RepID=A0A4S3M0A4_9FLAO|nr:fibronectin type III domain-containing protein [Robertkochia marina]THD67383.1 fibronectin type III domain-containing protein [Robertkochia marina]TRZ43037.1 fibronectin type III domain-containing protein [Robertkochia marina]